MKYFISFLLLLAIIAPTHTQTGIFVPELKALDSLMLKFMNDWDIPGASVCVVKDGRLVYSRGLGYADVENQVLVQPYHRFRIASVSKPVTSVAIMKLVESGQLNLNDKVFGENGILNDAEYLNIADNRLKNITVRMLLQHTAGWERYGTNVDPMFSPILIANALGVPPPPNPVQILRYMTGQSLDYVPGTKQAYQNFGYSVLGRVIEKVTGLSYEAYVQQSVLAPAGIFGMQLGKNLLADRLPDEVRYYHTGPGPTTTSMYGDGQIVPWQYGGFNVEAMDAHGGWIASSEDLARFLVAVDGFPSKPDILSPASISNMLSRPFASSIFAMGWSVQGGRWWHFGAMHGTSAYISRRNDGLEWAILLNATRGHSLFFPEWDEAVFTALDAVVDWPSHDLFSQVSGTTDTDNRDDFRLFPNPAEHTVFLQDLPEGDHTIRVHDALGRQVFRAHIGDMEECSIDVSQYPTGIYSIHIVPVNGARSVSKIFFVKKN